MAPCNERFLGNTPKPSAPPCAYCGVGCGLLITPDGRGGASVVGDPEHPANFGRTCSKGSALGETLGLGGRALHPMPAARRRHASRACHGTARLDRVAGGFRDIVERHGPNAVAF